MDLDIKLILGSNDEYVEHKYLKIEPKNPPIPTYKKLLINYNHNMSEIRVSIKNLTKQFGDPANPTVALDNCSIQIRAGEKIGLYGPSGAGKSTLLNIIGLAESPTSGSYYFDSKELNFSNENSLTLIRRSSIGYLFQYFNLIPSMTALENAIFPLILNGTNWNDAKSKGIELLKEVGLEHRINNLSSQLSGGEMQRVGLVRAIIHRPKLILADEPTGNLDTKNGNKVIDLLFNFLPKDSSIVIVSHSMDVIKNCDRLINLVDGKINE